MHCARPAICILKNLGLNCEVTFSINQILLLQLEGDEKSKFLLEMRVKKLVVDFGLKASERRESAR